MSYSHPISIAVLVLAGCGRGGAGGPGANSPPECPAGQVPDGQVCVPERCGVGTYGSLEAGNDDIYVDAAASGAGDGSANTPFLAIQEGLDRAAGAGGGRVVVAAGTYEESLYVENVHDDIVLSGRCADLVVLDGSGGDDVPAMKVVGSGRTGGVGMSGLTVARGSYVGVWVEQGAPVSVTDSDITGNTTYGLVVLDDSVVDVKGSSVRLTVPAGRETTHGVHVENTAVVHFVRSVIDQNSLVGVALRDDATVTLEDSVVSGTLPGANGEGGLGVQITGGTLDAANSSLEGNADVALQLTGATATATLTNTSIVNTAPRADGSFGVGIAAQSGATATLTGCLLDGNADDAVYLKGEGSAAALNNTTIRATHARPDGTQGIGIDVQQGASASASGCTFDQNEGAGVFVTGAGSTMTLEDTLVLATDPGGTAVDPRGVSVQAGATLTATRCDIDGNRALGLFVSGAGTTVSLVDTAVSNSIPELDGTYGDGIQIGDSASLSATGCTIDGNTRTGVAVFDTGARLEMTDTAVSNTRASPNGWYGTGVQLSGGAEGTLLRCSVSGNTGAGILVQDVGTTVDVADCTIEGTLRGRDSAVGIGLTAQVGATIAASDTQIVGTEGPGLYASAGTIRCAGCAVDSSQLAGVWVTWYSTLELTDSTVTNTTADSEFGGGFGVYSNNLLGESSLTITGSTIGPHPYAAVWLDGNGCYNVQDNVLSGSPGTVSGGFTVHGNALFAENGVTAWDGATGLQFRDNSIDDAALNGVLLSGASASLSGNNWSGNTVDLRQQSCDSTTPLTDADLAGTTDPIICPGSNILVAYDLTLVTIFLPTTTTAAEGESDPAEYPGTSPCPSGT